MYDLQTFYNYVMDYLKVYNVSYNINAYVFLLVVLVRDVVHYYSTIAIHRDSLSARCY